MQAVIIYEIEKEIARAIEKYPQLESDQDNIRAKMIRLYANTGGVAEIVAVRLPVRKAGTWAQSPGRQQGQVRFLLVNRGLGRKL